MSAECYEHGTDIVYPPGTWPVGVCPTCEHEKEVAALKDELVWLRGIANHLVGVQTLPGQTLAVQSAIIATRAWKGTWNSGSSDDTKDGTT